MRKRRLHNFGHICLFARLRTEKRSHQRTRSERIKCERKKIVRGSNNKSISRAHHNKNNMRKRVPYTSPNGTVCDAMEIRIGTKTFTHYPSDTHTHRHTRSDSTTILDNMDDWVFRGYVSARVWVWVGLYSSKREWRVFCWRVSRMEITMLLWECMNRIQYPCERNENKGIMFTVHVCVCVSVYVCEYDSHRWIKAKKIPMYCIVLNLRFQPICTVKSEFRPFVWEKAISK